MSGFFHSALTFLFHLGYFGPLVMGILDSSFLILPFGNDLLVVGLVAQHHQGYPFYVLMAACGSTLGVLALGLVARKYGEEGVCKLVGEKKFEKLKKRIGHRAGVFVAVACLAPPPFPFTMVIATASALDYSLWRLLAINFVSRGVRFAVLGFLAIKYGHAVLQIAKSPAFRWGMIAFIALCVVASAFSIWHWFHSRSRGK